MGLQVLRAAHSIHYFLPPFHLAMKKLLLPLQSFRFRSISTYASSKNSIPFSYCCNDESVGFNPRAYTSGRWLRRDKDERASRYINFDFEALCHKVLGLSPGASNIRSCKKLEGGFNRIFNFELDDNKRVVARLPFSLAGPAQLATSSEIATIRYRELDLDFIDCAS